jgi:hypothetical protein
MGKYFFDRVGEGRAEYDYKGRLFTTPEKARQLAELIALDLGIEHDSRWSGWTVEILNAEGEKIYSIPVSESELTCA